MDLHREILDSSMEMPRLQAQPRMRKQIIYKNYDERTLSRSPDRYEEYLNYKVNSSKTLRFFYIEQFLNQHTLSRLAVKWIYDTTNFNFARKRKKHNPRPNHTTFEAGGVLSSLERGSCSKSSSSFSYTGKNARINRISSTALTKHRKLNGRTTLGAP